MQDWRKDRDRIIGLGEQSFQKSYYPELVEKLEEIEESYTNYEELFSNLGDAIVVHDYQGRFLYYNQKARDLFNITGGEELEQYHIKDITSSKIDYAKILEVLKDPAYHNSAPLDWLIKPIGLDHDIPVQVTMSPVKWYGKDALVALLRDFSERKRFEQELIRAKERAEESDRLKSAFLANMSHEIRTPMNAILGFSKLLERADLSIEKQSQYLQIIQEGGKRMLNIINDIMSISKIEAGLTVLMKSEFDLHLQLKEIILLLGNEIDKKGLNLIVDIDDFDTPYFINSDDEKIYAIVINLLKNAIKFTDEGWIRMSYKKEGGMLTFCIQDTGIGIPQSRQAAIFDRFVQADIEDTMAREGAGLGLAISKAYIDMLEGSIHFISKEAEGTSFFVSIPL